MTHVTEPRTNPTPPPWAPAWVEVDLDALVANARVLRRAIPHGTRLGVLVKANGYGHGLEMSARAALAGGADELVVAGLAEGIALREAGIDGPVLVVYPILPAGIGAAAAAGLELTLSSLDGVGPMLDAWAEARPGGAARELLLHVEVDSGMGRGGIRPEHVVDAVAAIDAAPGALLAGIWSHLADGGDPRATGAQVSRFDATVDRLAATGRTIPARHLITTEALFAATAPAYDLVRIGLGFYGELGAGFALAPALATLAAELRPALTLRAHAVRIESVAMGAAVGYGGEWVAPRPSRIATLPIGYADGWARSSWPGGSVLVRGRRVPIVGRVSMDSVCVDVTALDGLAPSEEFVLLGAQGEDRISANEVAVLRGTIPNEVLASLGARLPRRYVGEARP
jgi:alanine racemase